MKNIILLIALFGLTGCPEEGVCVVTGNKLGSMGDPVSITHEGKEVKFCCSPCIKKFNANPKKYLK